MHVREQSIDEEDLDKVGDLYPDPIINQMYQSIRVDLPEDQADEKMRMHCGNLEVYIQTGNTKLDLLMSKIRLNHPIFKMISQSTFSFLIERSFMFKVLTGFGAYKENKRAQNNIYFILYGEF